jgi:hypothetical protein
MSEGRPHSEGQVEPEPLSGPPSWAKRVLIAGVVLPVLVLDHRTGADLVEVRRATRAGLRRCHQVVHHGGGIAGIGIWRLIPGIFLRWRRKAVGAGGAAHVRHRCDPVRMVHCGDQPDPTRP